MFVLCSVLSLFSGQNLSLCYVRMFSLCYVQFVAGGSPLASLAWLAKGGLNYYVNSSAPFLHVSDRQI